MDHNPRVWSKVDTACCGQSLLKFSVVWQGISRDKRFPEDGRKCCSRSCFFFSRSCDVSPRHATFAKSSTGRLVARNTVQRSERPGGVMLPLVEAQEAKSLSAHKVVVFG